MPAVCDLAAMRDAFVALGLARQRDQPAAPVDLVIDHSVQIDEYGTNARVPPERRHSSTSATTSATCSCAGASRPSTNMKVVPPGTGICHQVNLEYLAHVVFGEHGRRRVAYPDSLVGTDSHTTMVNGLGVFGWGVGGIEAEAVMLGQPMAMLIPEVVGFELTGKLPRGRDRDRPRADRDPDAAQEGRGRQVRRVLRRRHRRAVAPRPRDDREHGARVRRDDGLLPGRRRDARVPAVHRPSRRSRPARRALLQGEPAVARRRARSCGSPTRCRSISATVEPSIAGPARPQDRVPLTDSRRAWRRAVPGILGDKCGAEASRARRRGRTRAATRPRAALGTSREVTTDKGTFDARPRRGRDRGDHELHEHLEPVGADGRRACSRRRPSRKGLTTKPWVKTSLAPGSQVVTDYLERGRLMAPLEELGFYLAGYGCTTCIGNSGPVARRRSPPRSRTATSSSRRCCRATATSRAASTRWCARTTSRRRRSWSRTRSPAR